MTAKEMREFSEFHIVTLFMHVTDGGWDNVTERRNMKGMKLAKDRPQEE